jgi:hypothetical protein
MGRIALMLLDLSSLPFLVIGCSEVIRIARKSVRLTDEQREKIEPLLHRLRRSRRGGRPWISHREVDDAILWVLKTGAADV